ncbi:MAG: hypothetical protein Q7S29_02430 [Candidatus Peribacter sp.]|nr:hypothetical protein [Candidatus Peribacter sp.]
MLREERISGFVEEIWQWYAVQKRTLPWRDLDLRDDTERAYRILVSEVMLQQTQVERVKVIYERFLERFPTLRRLAGASNREVILAWRGMGYNSRALRLRDAACRIVEDFNGVFPKEMKPLESIKGIGHYTAAAIRNFAFNIPTPCIDTNIRRILHRTFAGPERPDGTWAKDDRYVLHIAEEVLDAALQGSQRDGSRRCAPHHDTLHAIPHDARNWHAALMDFGSLVQTKKNPRWGLCPLTRSGRMKTTQQLFERSQRRRSQLEAHSSKLREPGRRISGRFVPNRIVRGRIVEALRDAPAGLSLDALGRRVAADWSHARHRQWLGGILARLQRDRLVSERARKFILCD